MGHRQAFAWVDDWYDMSLVDVRNYESEMHRRTNTKVAEDLASVPTTPLTPAPLTPPTPSTPVPGSGEPTTPSAPKTSWFPWS